MRQSHERTSFLASLANRLVIFSLGATSALFVYLGMHEANPDKWTHQETIEHLKDYRREVKRATRHAEIITKFSECDWKMVEVITNAVQSGPWAGAPGSGIIVTSCVVNLADRSWWTGAPGSGLMATGDTSDIRDYRDLQDYVPCHSPEELLLKIHEAIKRGKEIARSLRGAKRKLVRLRDKSSSKEAVAEAIGMLDEADDAARQLDIALDMAKRRMKQLPTEIDLAEKERDAAWLASGHAAPRRIRKFGGIIQIINVCVVNGLILIIIGLVQTGIQRMAPSSEKGKEGQSWHFGSNPFRALWNAYKAPACEKVKIGLWLVGFFLVIFIPCYLLHRYAGFEHPLSEFVETQQIRLVD